MKKKVVIILPGALDLSFYPRWVKNYCLSILKFLKIQPTLEDHKKLWKHKISPGHNVYWMRWTRQIDPISLYLARKKLRRLLKHYKNEDVSIVAVSLASKIVLDVIRKNNFKNIKKTILVVGVNDFRVIDFPHPQIVNIFSEKDTFAKLAIEIFSPLHGGQRLNGKNVKNVLIPNLTHNDFCHNTKINAGKFKGKTITSLINSFL